MRLLICAIGRLKQGPERELAASYRKRAEDTGRPLGLRTIEIVEIRESRAQDAERRRTEESIALANVLPEEGMVVILDQRGENLHSAGLAAQLQRWRAHCRCAYSHKRKSCWVSLRSDYSIVRSASCSCI